MSLEDLRYLRIEEGVWCYCVCEWIPGFFFSFLFFSFLFFSFFFFFFGMLQIRESLSRVALEIDSHKSMLVSAYWNHEM